MFGAPLAPDSQVLFDLDFSSSLMGCWNQVQPVGIPGVYTKKQRLEIFRCIINNIIWSNPTKKSTQIT